MYVCSRCRPPAAWRPGERCSQSPGWVEAAHTHVCMYVWMYVCMCVWMYVYGNEFDFVCQYSKVCMYA